MNLALLITLATIMIPILGVFATLIAPRLAKRASIFVSVVNVLEISRSLRGLPDEFGFTFRSEAIEEAVSVAEIEIENNGHLDIANESFIDPIRVHFPDGFTLLSLTEDSDSVCGASFNIIDANNFEFECSLLKRKEVVKLIAICAHNSENTLEDKRDQFSFHIRLRDVKTANRKHPISVVIGKYLLVYLGVIIYLSIPLLIEQSDDKIIAKYDKTNVVLISNHLTNDKFVDVCDVGTSFKLVGKCQKVPLVEVSIEEPLQFVSGLLVGLSYKVVSLILFLSLMLTFLVSLLRLRRIRRMLRKLAYRVNWP